ncbi:MAG: ABC transporter substrate-binding protein [Holosporaceae bacterium]|jgi:putative ABC transport system substrate-binding protein|nr:ABC transporter substrate-binding protein [Holosporaceae bacterium]
MKTTATIALGIVFGILLSATNCDKKNDGEINVKVCKAIEHEALNSVVAGMSDYLKKTNKNYKISVETAQGNAALAYQIIAKFASLSADVVVTIGTSPSQCAFKFAKDGKIKQVFSSVTNPNDVSKNLKGNNVSGVSNFVDLEPQIELFQRIQPSLKTLGIIYNTGEANSAYIVEKLKEVCAKKGVKLAEQGISRISDVCQAADKLSKSVDAIFISNDNLALSGITTIVSICVKNKIPVYVSDADQVANGCLAALGPNQYDIGVQTGKIVDRIAAGEDVNKIAVEYPQKTELYLNKKAAQALGITIPEDVIKRATRVL